jgi:hypothetical protein
MEKPKIICLTPVRNEAWILNTFLKATSLWADYIIIADQCSTDGSREIALQYSKVILINNNQLSMHQAQTRKLLFEEAKKIKGNKILFSLDADEFLSGNFSATKSWGEIMNSKPGDIFFFKWINICENTNECIITKPWMHWASRVDDNILESYFPDNYIHEWRLPYPKNDANKFKIDDIYFIHFARVNKKRQINKNIFYQVSTLHNEPHKSIVSLFRMYHSEINEIRSVVNSDIYSFYTNNGISLLNDILRNDEGKYYIDEVKKYFKIDGIDRFAGLNIWEKDFLTALNVDDPRNILIKLLHIYLKNTQRFSRKLVIRFTDKILKYLHI